MPYLLTKLEIRYGKLEEFNKIMMSTNPAAEKKGWKLIGGYTNKIGRMMRVYDFWEVDDANAVLYGMNELMDGNEELAAAYGKIVLNEELELMETMPYHPG